jgi:hypothetical protein
MTDLKQQKDLTGGKGWRNIKIQDVVDHAKDLKTRVTTKIKNVAGGIKATPAILKKTFKKD